MYSATLRGVISGDLRFLFPIELLRYSSYSSNAEDKTKGSVINRDLIVLQGIEVIMDNVEDENPRIPEIEVIAPYRAEI